MLQTGTAPPALTVLEKAINERVGHSRAIFVDSSLIAERVFADHLLANVLLLGAAFQAGYLPLGLASLEQALADLGPASPEAFAWGRWAVHDPAAVTAALPPVPGQQPSSAALAAAASALAGRDLPAPLADLLVRRAAQAADYQDARRAGRFLDLVEQVAARDSAGRDWALTRAVAESWFRLLTYKDEYEVARLHLAADYGRVARDLGISGPYRVTYHLHPPVLRRLGLARKLPLGWPYEVAFRVLRRMRRLRGTPLDPFGWDRDRRAERALIGEYERLMLGTAGLPYDTQVRIAASVQSVKGYGPVKEKALAAWRDGVAELMGPA
jgi:indolepyruvate ferredoxin oxidoreductase